METKDIIEKVAAGLRRMKNKPDYLLFMQFHAQDWVWDFETICGIPVLYTDEFLHRDDDRDCPFEPCFLKQRAYMSDIYDFRRGYEEG